jgi:hypothetical protein
MLFFFQTLTDDDVGRSMDATWDSPSTCWSSSDMFSS